MEYIVVALEFLVVASILLVIYTYVGYPLLLRLLPEAPKPDTAGNDFVPPVTIILAVFRGKDEIASKIENTLSVDYPEEKRELIVITDGSDDGTDQIVEAYANRGVRLIRQLPRAGKTAAQKKGIAAATHQLLVFTDLTTKLEPCSLRNLVQPLADGRIGLVSSEDIWVSSDGQPTGAAQGAYVKYEMWLRNRESAVRSIVSASGCFYAVRKEFFEPIPDYLIDDTVIPLTVAQHGSRSIHEKSARSFIPMIPSAEREFTRRARMALGGINALMYKKQLLNPFRYGLFAIQLLSHKLFRWLVPFFLLLALIGNGALVALSDSIIWIGLLVPQLLFYATALVGYLLRSSTSVPKPIRLIYFFVSSNAALLLSWWHYFTRPKQATWGESRGSAS